MGFKSEVIYRVLILKHLVKNLLFDIIIIDLVNKGVCSSLYLSNLFGQTFRMRRVPCALWSIFLLSIGSDNTESSERPVI